MKCRSYSPGIYVTPKIMKAICVNPRINHLGHAIGHEWNDRFLLWCKEQNVEPTVNWAGFREWSLSFADGNEDTAIAFKLKFL